jgi:hypothetical protein
MDCRVMAAPRKNIGSTIRSRISRHVIRDATAERPRNIRFSSRKSGRNTTVSMMARNRLEKKGWSTT